MLGRYLRGRWLSIDGVGSVILGATRFFAVFTEIFAGGKAMRTSQPSKNLCTEADDTWATLHVTYRRNSVLLATSNLFLATVVISHGAKPPLAHFMMWVQRENKLLGKVRETAKSKGEAYVGPTPLSHLVGVKRDEIRTLMCGLLEIDVGEGPWTLLTALLAAGLLPKACHLIVELVLMSAASWDFRFTRKINSFFFKLAQYRVGSTT